MGTNATFTVKATGQGLTYQWYYSSNGGKTWNKSSLTGFNTNTLTVPMTSTRLGQRYRCVITDSSDYTVTSSEVVLNQAKANVVIRTQPSDYVGIADAIATFQVEAEGENLTYQWYYSKDNGKSWSKTSMDGATTDTLRVDVLDRNINRPRDGYQYKCVITDAEGVSLDSNAASVIVVATIVTQPEDFMGKVDETAVFTVEAEGENLTYQWYYSNNDGATWSKSGQLGSNTNTLTVVMTASRVGQLYRCQITNEKGNAVMSNPAALKKIPANAEISQQPTDFVGKEDGIAVFTVEAVGENLTYQWYYSKTNGATWSKSSMEGAETNTLYVEVMDYNLNRPRDGYLYKCVITDAEGNTMESDWASITVV